MNPSALAPRTGPMRPGAQKGPVVAYILKMFPRFSETFILNEILELESRGVRVMIYSLRRPEDVEVHADLARLRAPVTYLPERLHLRDVRGSDRDGRLRQRLIRAARSEDPEARKRVLQAAWLLPHLRATGAGHVHAHFATSATEVARELQALGDLPFSFTAHAKDIFHNSVREADLRGHLEAARFVVTVSDFNQRFLERLAPESRIRRIYNGLDLQRFSPPADAEKASGSSRLAAPDAPPLILAVGRLVEKKGFELLIEACELLRAQGREFRCLIVGKGEREASLRVDIATRGLEDQVTLAGPMPREALLELLPQARLFVAPCLVAEDGNRDGLPTVLIEAMAMGLPVISTPVTGIPELVVDGASGLLVPSGEAEPLAGAIARLLDQPALADRLARAGRLRVEEAFDLGPNIEQLEQLFKEAIDAHRLPVD